MDRTQEQATGLEALKPLLLEENPSWTDRYIYSYWRGRLSVRNQQYRLETKISTTFPRQIKASQERIAGLEKDIVTISKHYGKDFVITTNGRIYLEKYF